MLSLVANTILYPEIIIRSTVSITSNLISSIGYLQTITKGDPELQLLNLVDILNEINIIKTFIEEKNYETMKSKSVIMCLQVLKTTLEELETNINDITFKLRQHKQKWFPSFRSYNISDQTKQLPILKERMKKQFELFLKISSSFETKN
jgi:hypothetical protein